MKNKFLINLILLPTFLFPISTISCGPIKSNDDKNPFLDRLYRNGRYEKIFSRVDVNDYYEFIEFDKNHQPFIGDKLIAALIKDVVSNLGLNYGNIDFIYEKKDKKCVEVIFIWKYQKEEKTRKYIFSLDTDI